MFLISQLEDATDVAAAAKTKEQLSKTQKQIARHKTICKTFSGISSNSSG